MSKEEGEEKSNIEVSSLSFKRRARRGEETSEKKRKKKGVLVLAWLLLFGLKKKTREKSEIGLWRGSKKDSLFFLVIAWSLLSVKRTEILSTEKKQTRELSFV